MPFTRTQSALKKVLPGKVFEYLYRVATAGYYAKQRVADWWYYNTRLSTSDKFMLHFIKPVIPYTMVGRGGLVATYKVVENAERSGINGCLVECGIARGGCAILMIKSSAIISDISYAVGEVPQYRRRDTWLFDSFEGLSEPTDEDGILRKPQGKDKSSWDLAKGYCLGTQEEVDDLLFNKFGLDRDKVHLVKGWFQNTLPEYRERVGDIAVLRIDGDWYESTKCCLENLYDNVVDSGYVILDDYALVGCRKAVDEFFKYRGKAKPEIVTDGRGGGYFIK